MNTSNTTTPISSTSADARFAFGDNWQRFLANVTTAQIDSATNQLREKLGRLDGLTFLDIGCGSGLHSLAALKLGAARVHSFDFDSQSVGCTQEVLCRFAPHGSWTVEQGSALDAEYLASLGHFDVVYSWGVLHHTGNMWKALELAVKPLAPGGRLLIAIYNDQRIIPRIWWRIKRLYNLLPSFLRTPYVVAVMLPVEFKDLLASGPSAYISNWHNYYKQRGMSRWHDMVDWVGGFPFEVAGTAVVFEFYHQRGFSLEHLSTSVSGCNEFVFSGCNR